MVGDYAVDDDSRDAPFVFYYEFEEGGLKTVRKLAHHGSEWGLNIAHPHPRFDPSGERVVFTSNRRGMTDVYVVSVADPTELPVVEGDEHRAFA